MTPSSPYLESGVLVRHTVAGRRGCRGHWVVRGMSGQTCAGMGVERSTQSVERDTKRLFLRATFDDVVRCTGQVPMVFLGSSGPWVAVESPDTPVAGRVWRRSGESRDRSGPGVRRRPVN